MNETIKEDYLKQVRKLCGDYPNVLGAIEDLWRADRFREVYFYVYSLACKRGIVFTAEQRRIDERFYWEVVH